jgi:hypothetical protein
MPAMPMTIFTNRDLSLKRHLVHEGHEVSQRNSALIETVLTSETVNHRIFQTNLILRCFFVSFVDN